MNTKETRCTAAIQYRKNGANCAQSLLAAFSDILNITEAQALAMGAGLGGGDHCGLLIVSAAEILCDMMETERKRA